ncbi:gamma-glutamyl-gamma-aminobutyrate hydrolase family protein [Jeotgalibaca caeni]|uniref:gamma-glutamyl-gamma-aminobutyrate hydrolase family protein n=1 Tax=Jeotgalibaca caeni TaxID=3028623 RepID=UPI00237E0888|nr:gamma-glutamyl-gamma-aminobutyrate hydrolase family protein [Jeotgalibaca caeni]MDE1549505.1 gamma-glutamyl-gamma-aminobutyrate hydrolase family protein [Jeotgalibaca caeni]
MVIKLPLIGISGNQLLQVSTAFEGTSVAYTPQFFIDGLHHVGASPLILPIGTKEMAQQYVQLLDGLLLTGGYDVDPNLYGEDPHPQLQAIYPQRDTFELALIEAALERKIPILGICRGMQLLNVHFGGTLYQDLPTQYGEHMMQHVQKAPFNFPVHAVSVEADSYLHTLTGDRAMVNTFHHQGIKDLGKGLRVVATSSDGMVEAVEATDSEQDILALQWHPEIMLNNDSVSRAIFTDFVKKCQ